MNPTQKQFSLTGVSLNKSKFLPVLHAIAPGAPCGCAGGSRSKSTWLDTILNIALYHFLFVCGIISFFYYMATWRSVPCNIRTHILKMLPLVVLLSPVTAFSSLSTNLDSEASFSYRVSGFTTTTTVDFRHTNKTFESLGSFSFDVSSNKYLLKYTYESGYMAQYAVRRLIVYGDGTNQLIGGQADYQVNNLTNAWHATIRDYNAGLGNAGDMPSLVLLALFYSKANCKSMDDYLIPLIHHAREFGTNTLRTSYKPINAAPFLPQSYAIYARSAVTNGNLIKRLFGEQVNVFEYKVMAVTNIDKLVFPLTAAIKVYRKVEPGLNIPRLNYTGILQITNVAIETSAINPPDLSGVVWVSDLREYKKYRSTVSYSLTNQYILPLSHPAYIKCRTAAIEKTKGYDKWMQKATGGKTASNTSVKYLLLLLVAIPLVIILIPKIMRHLGKDFE